MSSFTEDLHGLLTPFRARIRRLLVERFACYGAAVAGGLAVLLVILDQFLPAWYIDEYALLALLALGALTGGIYGATRPLTDFAVARTIERRRNLQERASTAVAMANNPDSPTELRDLITADAVKHLTEVSPTALFPRHFTMRQKLPLILWGAAVLLFLLPSIPWLQSKETRQEREAMRKTGISVQQAAKELLENPDVQHSKTAKSLARKLFKLGVEMEKLRIPKKEALIRLNRLQEEMKKAEAQIAKELAARDKAAMAKASEALKNGLSKRSQAEKSAAESAKAKMAGGTPREKLTKEERAALEREERMQALANSLEKGDASQASSDMKKLGNSLQQNTSMSGEDRKNMSESLRQASQQMQQSSSDNQNMAESMQEAAEEMQDGSQQGQQQAGQSLQRTLPLPPGMMPGQQTMGRLQQGMGQCKQGLASNKPGSMGSMSGNKPGNGSGQNGQSGQNGSNGSAGNGQSEAGRGPHGQQSTPGANNNNGSGGTSGGEGGASNHEGEADPLEAGRTATHENSDTDPRKAAYSVDVKGAPGQADRTNVPYYEVYPGYRDSAESAINSDQVPASERPRVKEYFNKLNPNGR